MVLGEHRSRSIQATEPEVSLTFDIPDQTGCPGAKFASLGIEGLTNRRLSIGEHRCQR
jgi:hypothetical protein